MQDEVSITNDVHGQYFIYRVLLLGIDIRKISDTEHEVQGIDYCITDLSGSMGMA